jgi:DGQHR domain-containing protein
MQQVTHSTPPSMEPYVYPCITIKKKAWKFSMAIFFVDASDLKQWCGVYRKSISKEGYQRTINPEHYGAIKKFLNSSPDLNVIPNSIVIAFNDSLTIDNQTLGGAEFVDVKNSWLPLHPVTKEIDKDTVVSTGQLKVRVHPNCQAPQDGLDEKTIEEQLSDVRSAYVIDGQHRIWGGNAASSNVYYPVTGFLGINKEEQAFHFIVINAKAKKVSKHDIDAVIPEEIYENLQTRLNAAGIYSNIADIVWALDNDDDSPFASRIKWANNPDKNAPFGKGGIDKLIKQAAELPDDVKDLFENQVDLIKTLWRGVKSALLDLWSAGQSFAKNQGETYANELINKSAAVLPAIQITLNRWLSSGGTGPLNAATLEQKVNDYFQKLPHEFFYCVWKQKSITNDQRITELADLISAAIRTTAVPYGSKGKEWFAEPVSEEAKKAAKETVRRQKRLSASKTQRGKKKKN